MGSGEEEKGDVKAERLGESRNTRRRSFRFPSRCGAPQ